MNLISRRFFCGFNHFKTLHVPHCASERIEFLLVNNVNNAHIRCKMKLTNPDVFTYRAKPKRESWKRYGSSVGMFSYCLLAFPVLGFALGTWQVYRRKWKLGLIEDLKNRTKLQPVDLPKKYEVLIGLEDLEEMNYHPVRVKGTFLYDSEFLLGPKTLIKNGEAITEHQPGLAANANVRGFCVVTPFKLADRDLTILVNRGWIPMQYKNADSRKELQGQKDADIVGIVRLTEAQPRLALKNSPTQDIWFFRDLKQMAEHYNTAPVYIDQVASGYASSYPLPGQTRVTMRNEHLSYLITWYSLSAITGGMWYRNFIQKVPIL